jgi:hypothetical protein
MIGGSVSELRGQIDRKTKLPKMNRDGKQIMQINFGVAYPKQPGHTHWSQTEWGAQIAEIGKAGHPNLWQNPTFSWKITDGDSQIPDKNGHAPNTKPNYSGNWVIWFSQGWAPKLVNSDGTVELPDGAIVAGYYVQVLSDVKPNVIEPGDTAGVYINPVAVALAGEGDKIVVNVDTTAVGFGGALPAGARPVQPVVAGFGAPQSGFPAPVSGVGTPSNVMATSVPGATTFPSSIPVRPSAAFMQVPGAPAAPAPAAPQHIMTPKAGGATFEQFAANGWNEQAMREAGYLV